MNRFDNIFQKFNKTFSKKLQAALLCCVMLLCGCDGDESLPSEIIVSGGVSEQTAFFPIEVCGVTLEKAVERAVSLSPAVTEVICELGYQGKLVGISSYCDYPEGLSSERVGSTENPDIDSIIKLKPDAVFTLTPLSEREVYALGQEGIAVITVDVPADVNGYADMYGSIASAFLGKELDEDGLRKSDVKGADALAALKSAAEGVGIGSFVYITEKKTVAGADTFESSVLGLSGENVCAWSGYVTLQDYWEELIELRPDYLVAASALTEDDIRESATLTMLLETGSKLRFVSSRCFERPTARTAEVFSEIAADH